MVTTPDDLRARRLAADWHGGGGSAMYILCSTGAITEELADEINDCYPSAHDPEDFSDIEWLSLYVKERGTRGPIDGWNDLGW